MLTAKSLDLDHVPGGVARTGIEYDRVFLEHDSNGSVCRPNPGINTLGLRIYQTGNKKCH